MNACHSSIARIDIRIVSTKTATASGPARDRVPDSEAGVVAGAASIRGVGGPGSMAAAVIALPGKGVGGATGAFSAAGGG